MGDGKDAVALANIAELMNIKGLVCKPIIPEQSVEMLPPSVPNTKPANKGMERAEVEVDPTQAQKKTGGNGR